MTTPGHDLQRVQHLLRDERARLLRLTEEAARGADNSAQLEEARFHLEALHELAEAVQARAAIDAAAPAAEHPFQRQDYSVLVVDDHEGNRYSVSRALRASGYRTLEASAGAEALQLSEFASALVLDVQLPDLHGFEVCRLVRNAPGTSTLPIVHVSAVHRSFADRQASREAGADDFLTTPVDFTLLAQRLDTLLCERA
jgi:CheY-like chemotaxis protein